MISEKFFPENGTNDWKTVFGLCIRCAQEKYGVILPAVIRERLNKELSIIKEKRLAGCFLLAYEIAKENRERGFCFGTRGTIGSSFAAYLLGITKVNPLPPHYYCPRCKKIAFVGEKWESGFDLDRRRCSNCGSVLRGDGHNIPWEIFFENTGPKICFDLEEEAFAKISAATLRKAEELMAGTENGTVLLYTHPRMEKLHEWEERTGIAPEDIDLRELDLFDLTFNDDLEPFLGEGYGEYRKLFDLFPPVNFSDMVKIDGIIHSVGAWVADEEWLSGPTSLCRERFTFEELLSSRDDVMFWYMKHGHDRKEAYRLCGTAAFSGCYGYGDLDSLDNDDEEDQLNFPSDMGCYLLPKAHLVDDMANLLRLVWYETKGEDA